MVVLQMVVLIWLIHGFRAYSFRETYRLAVPRLLLLGRIILLRNLWHEPLLLHSKPCSLIGTISTKRLLKLVFGFRMIQAPFWDVLLSTSCRASFTKTDMTWVPRYHSLLANSQEEKWCFLSLTQSCSAYFLVPYLKY